LPKNVRDQVLEVTKAVISEVRHGVNFISRITAAEKERSQAELGKHEATSLEDEPERLRAKVEGLNEGIEKFTEAVGRKRRNLSGVQCRIHPHGRLQITTAGEILTAMS